MTALVTSASKVSIVGAGAVGVAIAYASMIKGVVGSIAMYDIDGKRTRAEVMDLNHGSQFVPRCHVIGSDDIAVTADSTLIVITAGARQKPGQTRLELAGVNVKMIQSMIPQLLEHSPDALIMVVTNPVDVVTFAALRASGLDRSRVFGSGTVLDTGRLRFLIAQRAGLDISNVHAYIVGEHGDSEITLWSGAYLGGAPLTSHRSAVGPLFTDDIQKSISKSVVDAAYEIIQGKGATDLAIGLSATRIIQAVLQDQHAVLPISTYQQGCHGIDGVCLSLPTVVSAKGAGEVLEVPISESELSELRKSAATLKETQNSLGL
jgi:L-lactate dehydrogenase